MGTRKCPRANELEALVAGRSVAAGIKRHVEGCPVCGPIVAELRNSAELLAQIREATAEGPDAATRERVLEICARVAGEIRSRPAPE